MTDHLPTSPAADDQEAADRLLVAALVSAAEQAEQALSAEGTPLGASLLLVRAFSELPRKHIHAAELVALLEAEGHDDLAADLDADRVVRELCVSCAEFSGGHLDTDGAAQGSGIAPLRDRIAVVFRLSKWSKLGRVVLGTAGPVPTKQRDLDPLGPLWTVTLNLPYWLAANDLERQRLVHHELGHLALEGGKPRARAHDVEEFTATVARFGLADRDQAALVAHAVARPDTVPLLRSYDFSDDGQGLLFPLGYEPREADIVPFAPRAAPGPVEVDLPLADQLTELIAATVRLPDDCDDAQDWHDALLALRASGDDSPAIRHRVAGIRAAMERWESGL